MIQINVAQLLKEPIGSTRSYEVDEPVVIAEGDRAVRGQVNLIRTNRGILVRGALNTEMELTCSRCLTEFICPLSLEIEEEYFPTIDVLTGAPVAIPDEPGAFTINQNNILDLTEAIRQYTLLAIPMKPLCQEDCAGLCPTCGANLNEKQCQCPPAPVDPRWAKLTILMPGKKSKR
ncbi:MAG TPA: DUF177 domain-containing protein [Dehalococcoidales bacterium]